MNVNKLFLVLFSFILFIGFSSCGDDDDKYVDISSANDIIGTWQITKATFEVEGKNKNAVSALKQSLKPLENDYKGTYTFNSDGTFESKETALNETHLEHGTYTVSNSTIYMYEESTGIRVTCKAAMLNGSLVLIFDGTDLVEEELNKEGMSLSQLQITKIAVRMTFSRKVN